MPESGAPWPGCFSPFHYDTANKTVAIRLHTLPPQRQTETSKLGKFYKAGVTTSHDRKQA